MKNRTSFLKNTEFKKVEFALHCEVPEDGFDQLPLKAAIESKNLIRNL